jgi:hypothetical protein
VSRHAGATRRVGGRRPAGSRRTPGRHAAPPRARRPRPARREQAPSAAGPSARRGRTVVVLTAALALIAAAGLAVSVRAPRDAAPPPPPAPAAAADRTQRTVVLAVADPGRPASGVALLANDSRARSASVLLLPTRLLAAVPGQGSLPLARAFALPGGAAANAVADTVGVTVDGFWTLPPGLLGGLVNRLGGVRVDVDTDVLGPPAGAGGRVVIVRAGEHRLDGTAAVAYAGWLGDGEAELARLPRLQGVLDGILAALPADPVRVATLLRSLGPGSRSTAGPDRLAALLVALAAARDGDAPLFDALPVLPIDTGGQLTSYRVDPARLSALVSRTLAASVPARRPGAAHVLVLDGIGRPGLGEGIRSHLIDAGFGYAGVRNAARFGEPRSVVLVSDAAAHSRRDGEKVAAALGLPADSVRVSRQEQSVADVLVLIGADYRG